MVGGHMFKGLDMFSEPQNKPVTYLARRANGRAVSVTVADNGLELRGLYLQFERRIEKKDLKNGKLLPVTLERVKRRGGKRTTSLALSLESAEALHTTLGKALRDARKRNWWHQFRLNIFSVFRLTVEHDSSGRAK